MYIAQTVPGQSLSTITKQWAARVMEAAHTADVKQCSTKTLILTKSELHVLSVLILKDVQDLHSTDQNTKAPCYVCHFSLTSL